MQKRVKITIENIVKEFSYFHNKNMKGKDLKLNWKISQPLAMKNIVQF